MFFLYLLLHLPLSSFLSLFISLSFSYDTPSCLWYSCPYLSPWETENSQSHNYSTELSISPSINPVGKEGTRERKERAEKGDERFRFVMKRATLVRSPSSSPRVLPSRWLHVFGLRSERITPPLINLTPPQKVKQVTIQHRSPILITRK